MADERIYPKKRGRQKKVYPNIEWDGKLFGDVGYLISILHANEISRQIIDRLISSRRIPGVGEEVELFPLLKYIFDRPEFSAIHPRAEMLIDKMSKGRAVESVPMIQPEDLPPHTIERVDLTRNTGLEFAVERIRQMEVHMSIKMEDCINRNNMATFKETFDVYIKLVDQLRRAEAESLKVLEAMGNLVSLDKAQGIFSKGLIPLRQRLLALPRTISPRLVGMDAVEVADELERAVNEALHDCAKMLEERSEK
jgi:hypothetical protein